MTTTRRGFLSTVALTAAAAQAQTQRQVTKYVRFRRGQTIAYGIMEGETIRQIQGDLFGSHTPAGASFKQSEVTLLYPCEPPKVFAVGLNYKSHLGDRKPPSRPEIFFKPTTSLQNPGAPITLPKDARNAHYEGELVLVMGKRARNASEQEARDAIFGITCGNDVSERDWQNGPDKDLQWWRAKGADTFAPLGPVIARGLDSGKLLLQTRLNGKVVQKQYTSDLLFGPPAIVSFISKYVTLEPGDVIYTGTPGETNKLSPGDVVEVEIEGIGVLRNPVISA